MMMMKELRQHSAMRRLRKGAVLCPGRRETRNDGKRKEMMCGTDTRPTQDTADFAEHDFSEWISHFDFYKVKYRKLSKIFTGGI